MPRARKNDPRAGLSDKFLRERAETREFPTLEWREDICGFARDVLGVRLTDKQKETLLAIQDGTYITIRGGRKSGKTLCLAIAAWWYVCTFDDARVILLGPVGESIERTAWREICQLYRKSRIHLGGDLLLSAQGGWRGSDAREIFGRAPKDAGGVRGLSGANVFYIIDEASDVDDLIWETLDGNMGGSIGPGRNGKVLLVSNPTRLQGFFYRSHRIEDRWLRVHMPAEARDDIPGMTGTIWIKAMADYYGEDSTHYIIHVLGDFPSVEEDRIVHESWLQEAEKAFVTTAEDSDGDLTIGLDPATSENNDEAAIAIRRGNRIVEVSTYRGQSEELLAGIVAEKAEKWRALRFEIVRVVVDAQGPIGQRMMNALRAIAGRSNLDIIGLYYDRFRRTQPTLAKSYYDLNAARWGCFSQALQNGLSLAYDRLLHDELLLPSWVEKESGKRGMTRKEEFRELLNRSPDRADAVINACWDMTEQPRRRGVSPNLPAKEAPRREKQPNTYRGALWGPNR